MMTESRFTTATAALALLAAAVLAVPAAAGDEKAAMFGNGPKRNMVNLTETGLPAEWDVETGKNVKWSQPVGSQSYAGPVIYGGKAPAKALADLMTRDLKAEVE